MTIPFPFLHCRHALQQPVLLLHPTWPRPFHSPTHLHLIIIHILQTIPSELMFLAIESDFPELLHTVLNCCQPISSLPIGCHRSVRSRALSISRRENKRRAAAQVPSVPMMELSQTTLVPGTGANCCDERTARRMGRRREVGGRQWIGRRPPSSPTSQGNRRLYG